MREKDVRQNWYSILCSTTEDVNWSLDAVKVEAKVISKLLFADNIKLLQVGILFSLVNDL